MKCIDAPYIETRDLPTTVSYELKHRVVLRYHYDTFIVVLYQSLVLALYHTAYLLAFGTCQTGTGMIPALNIICHPCLYGHETLMCSCLIQTNNSLKTTQTKVRLTWYACMRRKCVQ